MRSSGADLFEFDATVSSPHDTPQRHADVFRAMSEDGSVYGERVLLLDHADEQWFTRDLCAVSSHPLPDSRRKQTHDSLGAVSRYQACSIWQLLVRANSTPASGE